MEQKNRNYFNHNLLKKDTIEYRFYQEAIVGTCANKNSLIVLPTGLGKTIIALLISVIKLHKNPQSQVIFLAPTKPLIQQHYETFKDLLVLDDDKLILITGTIPPDKRAIMYNNAKICFCTPQTLQNDIINSRFNLKNVSLIIFDEAHRAIGNYAYVFIAEKYMDYAKRPQILAITASPGSDKEKILEIIKNLNIEKIEVRTEESHDVKPYIQDIDIEWMRIDLPKDFMEIKELIEIKFKECLKILSKNKLINTINIHSINRTDLIKLQKKIPRLIQTDEENKSMLFESIRAVALAIRFSYMLELLETQGISSLSKYLDKLYENSKKGESSRTLKDLMQQPFMNKINQISKKLIEQEIEHPKLHILRNLLENQFKNKPESRVIVFCHFRTSARIISEGLKSSTSIKAIRFVGQQSKGEDKGLTQKAQIEILNNFKLGYYNTLIATSVAEEGLDIAECDLIIFYDSVPSAIRDIQRRGRTGRKKPGKVIILMTKGTRDESYYWVSHHKKKKMKSLLDDLLDISNQLELKNKLQPQKKITDFIEKKDEKTPSKIRIIVDSRESSSAILKILSKKSVDIQVKKLKIGDYILSDRVAIERKTSKDFIASIIDGRLFKEIKTLKNSYTRVIVIIEGEFLYGFTGMSKESIDGAILSIILNFFIPIIFTKDSEETANWLYNIAKKEQDEKRKPLIRFKKVSDSPRKIQEYILAGFPEIDSTRAKDLLNYFGSLDNLFNAPIEEIVRVKGIGPKIAENIKNILKTRYI